LKALNFEELSKYFVEELTSSGRVKKPQIGHRAIENLFTAKKHID